MKASIILFIILFNFNSFSQETKIINKTIIQNFGKVYTVNNPELILDKNKTYKVIFDIYTDSKDNSKINPLLNTVARFINMHVQTGMALENIEVVVVLHGEATKNALTSNAFIEKYTLANPNNKLLIALNNANVKTYVCGQSYAYNEFKSNELNKNVKMALSALTVLVEYQSQGYQLITFN